MSPQLEYEVHCLRFGCRLRRPDRLVSFGNHFGQMMREPTLRHGPTVFQLKLSDNHPSKGQDVLRRFPDFLLRRAGRVERIGLLESALFSR